VLVTQHGVPFAEPDWLARPFARIGDAFAHTHCYLASVPANYGGFLAFTMASDSAQASNAALPDLRHRHGNAAIAARYDTPDIHNGAFSLPPYVSEIIA
jgi:spermidine synthase